ncbi:MAG: glycosyltransferase [Gordonibacter sp.]|uniref:glycosyltransferase n=1 Tax=Gordonibacter sp. TaxID=1968902 RepID=UPI00321F8F6D
MNYAFLILHYQNVELTRSCVESILSNPSSSKPFILIVDNASPNGSGVCLKQDYANNQQVEVLLNKKNLGFAKGNNVGLRYLNETYSPEFIVMLNNDVEIISTDFCQAIKDEYVRSEFAVLGPRIILLGDKQDLYGFEPAPISSLVKSLVSLSAKRVLCVVGAERIIRKIEAQNDADTASQSGLIKRKLTYQRDVVLNGCCLVFSKKYFNEYSGIDDRTTMYKEEQLLYLRIKKKELRSIYNPELVVFHNASSSERLSGEEYLSKKKRFYKYQTQSTMVLLNSIVFGERERR